MIFLNYKKKPNKHLSQFQNFFSFCREDGLDHYAKRKIYMQLEKNVVNEINYDNLNVFSIAYLKVF